MRPALLVIIMDFLVSSLLLFISGPGSGPAADARRAAAWEAAAEFSPAAVFDMEQQWGREYQQQLAETRLSAQADQLTLLTSRGRELAEAGARLENQVAAQSGELDKRQSAIAELRDQRARQEAALRVTQDQVQVLARDKTALAAEKEDVQRRAAQLAAAKAEIERLLREAEAKKMELLGQTQQLNSRVAQQAETIRQQTATLASQQQTIQQDISTLARDQSKIAGSTEALRLGQEQMQSALANFQALTARLPGTLQDNARRVAEQQQRLETAVTGLVAMARSYNPELNDAERKQIREQLDSLANLNRGLGQRMSDMAAAGAGSAQIGADLSAVRRQQTALQDELGGLAVKLGEFEAKQIGPYAKFRDARVLLRAGLTAHRIGGAQAPGPAPESFTAAVYAPLLFTAERFWLAVNVADLGITWRGLEPDLADMTFTLAVPHSPASVPLRGPVRLLAAEPHIALVDLRQEPALAAALADRSHVKPAMLIGRAGLEKRGARDLYLFKRSAEGQGFAVEVAPDLDRPGYLIIRRAYNRWINFLAAHLLSNAGTRAEAGDFLVTAEGEVVGVMVDDLRGYVLSDSDLLNPGVSVQITGPGPFARDALNVRKTMK
ncbi:MAG: hypothetical protein NTV49_13625 [Kiritimatiellaeota bacterium]|nr:hypothetical protein [Kiritimatiellota bacterium]